MDIGITNKEFEESDERRREEFLANKQTKKIRITSGGSFRDFDDFDLAVKFLTNQAKRYCYASINMIYPGIFLQVESEVENKEIKPLGVQVGH